MKIKQEKVGSACSAMSDARACGVPASRRLDSLSAFRVSTCPTPLQLTQDGVCLGDVQLPAWAVGCPLTFIHAMREALEGPLASASMHHWIDLVFGCKQRGVGDDGGRAQGTARRWTRGGPGSAHGVAGLGPGRRVDPACDLIRLRSEHTRWFPAPAPLRHRALPHPLLVQAPPR